MAGLLEDLYLSIHSWIILEILALGHHMCFCSEIDHRFHCGLWNPYMYWFRHGDIELLFQLWCCESVTFCYHAKCWTVFINLYDLHWQGAKKGRRARQEQEKLESSANNQPNGDIGGDETPEGTIPMSERNGSVSLKRFGSFTIAGMELGSIRWEIEILIRTQLNKAF